MTDTAKPTPGPVRFTEVKSNWPAEGYKEGGWHEALWSDGANQPIMVALDQDDNAARFDFPNPKDMDFIQEAYAVYTETNLTPRQLLEQRDELANALNEIANSKFCNYDETSHGNYAGQYGIGVTDGHRFCANIAIAALAKCGKVGE